MSELSASREPERHRERRILLAAGRICAGAAVFGAFYLLIRSNYLLFHGIIELFAAVVGCAIFVVAWNTRKWVSNDYLLFLGIAYLFVAVIDVYHTLAYRGMGVFPGFGSNEPTQLWILARYVEALSLLFAPLFLSRRLRLVPSLVTYGLVVGLGLLSICRFDLFPNCFIEGQGLTAFKVGSEYAISLILLAALWVLYRRRGLFEPRVFRLLAAAILTTVAAEVFFTLYTDVYGVANVVGHLFKLVSFYLVYSAVVVTSLRAPYSLLFRDLKEERDRARRYLDVAGVVMLVVDRTGAIQLINRCGTDLLGYREDEIVGLDWFERFLPDGRRAAALELFSRLMAGETAGAEYAEGPVVMRGGGARTIAWHNTILRDASGAITGMLSSGDDVTEQRMAERALAASEERFKLLFHRAPDAYYLSDLDGRFVDANAAAEALVGFRKEDLLGKSFAESGLLRSEDVLPALQLLAMSAGGRSTGPDEVTLVRKDGSFVVAEIRTEPVEVDGRSLVLGIARDATQRKATEKALKESEERFRSLFDGAIEGVFCLDMDGRLIQANRALVDLMDMSPEEAIGKRFSDLLLPGSAAVASDAFARLLAVREPMRQFLMEVTLFNGRHLWIELNASQILVDDAVVGVQGSVRDVSERRQAEERLIRSNVELQALAARLDVAREEERAAVAWELHDQIAQALAAVKMDVESCSRRLPADVLALVHPELERVRDLLDETIGRLRRLYTDLVPVMLEDLGLATTIEWEADQFRRQSDVDVQIGRVCDVPSLDQRTQLGIYRVLQEALEWAARTEDVARIGIDFEIDNDFAVLCVSSDGRWPADAKDCCEMVAIRERSRSWGGQVSVEASPTAGVVLKVTVPLPTAIRG